MFQLPTSPVGDGFAPVPVEGTCINRTGSVLAAKTVYKLDLINVLDADTAGYAATNSLGPCVPGSSGGSASKRSGWASITASSGPTTDKNTAFYVLPKDPNVVANVADNGETPMILSGLVRVALDTSSANVGDPVYVVHDSPVLVLATSTTNGQANRQVGVVLQRAAAASLPLIWFHGVPTMRVWSCVTAYAVGTAMNV